MAIVLGLTLATWLNAPPAHAVWLHYTGWTRFTILEQFNVTSTQTTTYVGYQDNGSQLRLAVNMGGTCYSSAFPVWTIQNCLGYLSDGTPYWVIKENTSRFTHSTGIAYTMYSYFFASGGGNRSWDCEIRNGSLPPFWYGQCVGDYIQSGTSPA